VALLCGAREMVEGGLNGSFFSGSAIISGSIG
jgi:hypothetical protein